MWPRQEERRKLVPAASETSEKQDKEEMTLEEPHTPTNDLVERLPPKVRFFPSLVWYYLRGPPLPQVQRPP
jgi:hypothetical protein